MSGKGAKRSAKRVDISTKFTPRFLADLDGRLAVVRELTRRLNQLVADLGGSTTMSYQQLALARRVIFLEGRLESMESDFVEGKESGGTLMTYTVASNALLGICKTLGIRKQAPTITLEQHIERMSHDDDK